MIVNCCENMPITLFVYSTIIYAGTKLLLNL